MEVIPSAADLTISTKDIHKYQILYHVIYVWRIFNIMPLHEDLHECSDVQTYKFVKLTTHSTQCTILFLRILLLFSQIEKNFIAFTKPETEFSAIMFPHKFPHFFSINKNALS